MCGFGPKLPAAAHDASQHCPLCYFCCTVVLIQALGEVIIEVSGELRHEDLPHVCGAGEGIVIGFRDGVLKVWLLVSVCGAGAAGFCTSIL